MTPDELTELFTERFGDQVESTIAEAKTFTVTLTGEAYVEAARICRDDARLDCDMFDCSFGVDERDEGFAVVSVLYSTAKQHRILLRTRCAGGREKPTAPTLTHLYAGANWMERETYDMFGVEFDGHPGVLPRILCIENFEGWPLRKDFFLASREAKPWPGVKEPAELDEDGNVIVRPVLPGDAAGPSILDEAMAEQARKANPQPEPEVEAPAEVAELPAGDATATTAPGGGAAAAAATADDARKRQAEARAAKAAQRAAEAGGTATGDDTAEDEA